MITPSIYNPIRAVMAGDRKDIIIPNKMKLETIPIKAEVRNNKVELTNEVCKFLRKQYRVEYSKQLSKVKRYH